MRINLLAQLETCRSAWRYSYSLSSALLVMFIRVQTESTRVSYCSLDVIDFNHRREHAVASISLHVEDCDSCRFEDHINCMTTARWIHLHQVQAHHVFDFPSIIMNIME